MPSPLSILKSGVATDADIAREVQIAAGDGAIAIKSGVVLITKGTAAALTLGTPSTAQNGVRLAIVATTAAAHTVTAGAIGFNAGATSSDVGTFTAAIGNGFEVIAYNGNWYTVGTPRGVTFA